MVKTWMVTNKAKKATYLRREPIHDHNSSNVVRLVRNGELVAGEFVFVRRASREAGLIKIRHLQDHCGASMKIKNADGSSTTLMRRQAIESTGEGNTVCYAAEGELVSGEFLFVKYKDDKKGGYIKLKYVVQKDDKDRTKSQNVAPEDDKGLTLNYVTQQKWAVLDATHDGAWLRRLPVPERSKQNIISLIRNGNVVWGDFLFARASSTNTGFVNCQDLEQLSLRTWKVKASTASMRKQPFYVDPPMVELTTGEELEGEFIYVVAEKGSGYIKRHYLTAISSQDGDYVTNVVNNCKLSETARKTDIWEPSRENQTKPDKSNSEMATKKASSSSTLIAV